MFSADDVAEIEAAIQLAIAPAFLLTGIFSALSVLTGRLGRLIDRERAIRDGVSPALPDERARLAGRARCAHNAIASCVVSAMLLGLLIMLSFVGVFLGWHVAWVLAVLLIGAMAALVAALLYFLAEIRLASQHLPLADDSRS